MMEMKSALIVGVGSGLSASLARLFADNGLQVALASRNPDRLAKLAGETAAATFACEATEPEEVAGLFDAVIATQGVPDIVVYNASARARGPIAELVPEEVARAIAVSAYGGFLVGQQAARCMLSRRSGAILFTGASASVKGYSLSAPFAMGKFALRGLAQSMARELSPQGIHVAHFVIDGAIRNPGRTESADKPDSMLDPDAIAASYWHVVQQPRSAWTWEVELRPWVEKF
jgi:NAD(P)-dependent dehydrogenase (short-subunit alcohol dehydrogenase family)